jgi:hypothetical protein
LLKGNFDTRNRISPPSKTYGSSVGSDKVKKNCQVKITKFPSLSLSKNPILSLSEGHMSPSLSLWNYSIL